jgi:kinesin family protein 20
MDFLVSTLSRLSVHKEVGNSDFRMPLSTESSPPSGSFSRMQVFLRIRPTSSTPVEDEYQNSIYNVENPSTLLVKQINSNNSARRLKSAQQSENKSKKKFTFSKIFNFDTSQLQFFNEAVRPAIHYFSFNQNFTILNYGTTDAGKSYSMFGSIAEPGIIPRSIKLIYSAFNCTLFPLFKPDRFNNVISINENERVFEAELKEAFLASRLFDKVKYEEAYEEIRNSKDSINGEFSPTSIYSIWISFIEIYNEQIFDLLEVDEEGKNMQLKLACDRHGVTYIQGMRSICATSGLEAYGIFTAGQARLSRASTLNYKSSRSHSIFIIKLLKYEKNSAASEVEVIYFICLCICIYNCIIDEFSTFDLSKHESKFVNYSL